MSRFAPHRRSAAIATTSLCMALLALCGCATAGPPGAERVQQAQQRLHQRFMAADKDGNGQLTRAEAQAGMPRVASAFDQIDTTRKGYVTEAEITRHAMQQAAGRYPASTTATP